jgi:dTDP-4-dehydrorhamnose reductase
VDKLLVTRSDSLLGRNLAPTLGDRMDVIAVERAESGGDAMPEIMAEAVRRERPQLVVHAGAMSLSAWDAAGVGGDSPLRRRDMEREAAQVIALGAACREVRARFILVSSDAVFDGPRMFHTEQTPVCARRGAGRAIADLETALRDAANLMIRTHAYGWSAAEGGTNSAERMFRELTAETECGVDAVRHATPMLASDLAECLFAAYRAGLSGTYHVAGAERTSPYRFAAEMAAAFGTPGRFVHLTSRTAASHRPYVDETSLNTLAFRRAIEAPLPMLREGLARFAAQAFNGYRAALHMPATAVCKNRAPTIAIAQAA